MLKRFKGQSWQTSVRTEKLAYGVSRTPGNWGEGNTWHMRWAMRDQTPVLDQGGVEYPHHPHYNDNVHDDEQDEYSHCQEDYQQDVRDDVNLEELFCSVHF